VVPNYWVSLIISIVDLKTQPITAQKISIK
jgi:hypothetical protein